MKIKQIIGILALIIVLAACGSNGEGEVNLENQEPITTFKFLGSWTDKDLNKSEQAKIMEEHTGMPAEYSMLPVENADEKLQLELSSNTDYGMVQLNVEQFGSLADQGALLDLSPYLEEYAPNMWNEIDKKAWDAVTTEDGKIYGIPRMGASSVIINEVYVREDILKKEGYEIPKTTDELLTATCGLAEKGYQTPWASGNETYLDLSLRGSFGVPNEWNNDKDGNLIHISQDDRYKAFLDFEKKMYDCGAMGNDYETIKFDDAVQRFVTGKSAFLPGAYWNAGALMSGMEVNGDDFFESVAIIPSFTGPEGYNSSVQASECIDNITAIPVYQEKYAVALLEYADKLNDVEWYSSVLYGKEGENYKVLDDGSIYVHNKITYDNGTQIGFGFSIGGPTEVIRTSTNSGFIERQEKLESGFYVSAGAEMAAEYALAATDGVKDEYGSPNPIAMVIGVEDWTSNALAISNEMKDFSKLYVSGQKTDSDWEEFKSTMEEKFQIKSTTTQLEEKLEQIG